MLSVAVLQQWVFSSATVLLNSSVCFWADEVRIYPKGVINPEDQVVIEVLVTTVHAPTFLYQPFTVTFQGNEVVIDLFVDMGPFTAVDHLLVPVEVGQFSAGAHGYTVAVHDPSGAVADLVTGSFEVAGIPSIPALGRESVVVMALLLFCAGAIIQRRRHSIS